ncbi:MAG: hypothetical protein PHH31_08925, partial [Acidaminococcaceae bacterium]|nr:hypothetical protein [Acidaminococcaceae bacterium]
QTAVGKNTGALTVNNMDARQTIEYLFLKHLITTREAVLMHYGLDLLGEHASEKDKQSIVQESYKRISSPNDRKAKL